MYERLRFATAILLELLLFTIFFYIDAKNIIAPTWKKVIVVGLNPVVLVFYALSPIALWWAYRAVYQFAGEQFWYAGIIHALPIRVAHLSVGYIVTRQPLSSRNWVSLALGIIAIIVSS